MTAQTAPGTRVAAAPAVAPAIKEKVEGMLPYHIAIATHQTYARNYVWLAKHTCAARALALPVALAVAASAPFLAIAQAIECMAYMIINLIGSCFKAKGCSMKNFGESFHALLGCVGILGGLVSAVVNLFALIIVPEKYAPGMAIQHKYNALVLQHCININKGRVLFDLQKSGLCL